MSESRDAVLRTRYLHEGEAESDFYVRVANAWGSDEAHKKRLIDAMSSGRALFNTPALANAGRSVQMGSACFVLGIEDSMESIMETLKNAALVHKSGGGTGFNFSDIRPKGSLVSTTGRPAPGAVHMLKLYSHTIAHVTQAGLRPGANMGILDFDHPDIEEFITVKAREGDIHNFNISVSIPDRIMYAFINDELTPHQKNIWDLIVHGAWLNGEPGVFFYDTVNNKALHAEPIKATNPCGEVPLRDFEACVLGSVNLAAYVSATGDFDVALMRDDIFTLVEGLDNIIERQDYAIPEIEREQKRYRKIGLGVMGYADMLCKVGLEYGSPESLEFTEKIAALVQRFSYEASERLAQSRGFYDGYKTGMEKRRNLNCQVIAPTGTIARLAGCSWSIEPHFDVDENGQYDSFIVGGQFTDTNPFWGHKFFKPASKVTVDEHVAVQAVWQKYVDQAVSKTINGPNSMTREDVERAYVDAWRSGCKGLTILREGSREDTVIGAAKGDGDCVGAACSLEQKPD